MSKWSVGSGTFAPMREFRLYAVVDSPRVGIYSTPINANGTQATFATLIDATSAALRALRAIKSWGTVDILRVEIVEVTSKVVHTVGSVR